MKRKLKFFIMLGVMLFMFFAMGISASAYELYEPDGTSSTVYQFDSSECNRKIVVTCRDTDGKLLKKVTYHTKHGEDRFIILRIYNYDITAFSSDQGLWETCKLMYTSGGTLMTGDIEIDYYFRTALSADTINVSVTMRKMEDIEISEYHYKALDPHSTYISYHRIFIRSETVSVGEYIYLGGGYTGFSPFANYENSISGNFSYRWLDDIYRNIDNNHATWDIVKSADFDDRVDYTEFDENEDGRLTYMTNRKIDVDFYYDQNKYTVSFDANGGTGSVPPSQTEFYGFDVTIGNEAPTKSGYIFRGWSSSNRATFAEYLSGDTYTMGLSQTLYAVWEIYDYEFSISDLSVSEEEIYPNTVISVNVRTDSWDRNDAYEDIPVELYYDGALLSTEYVDYPVYGYANLTFEIDVGTVIGEHTVETRINWNDRNLEVDPTNNTQSITITVKSDEYSFEVVALTGNARYTEGTEVTTSYLIYNDSEMDVYPTTGATASFRVYYYAGDSLVTLSEQLWENYVVPANDRNLIYFRWYVPDGLADVTLYCECSINTDGNLNESVLDNNTATLTTVIAAKRISQTENPSYSASPPSDFVSVSVPSATSGSASWNMWEYENGSYVLKNYGLKPDCSDITIYPASTCNTFEYKNGTLSIKSGYGISIAFSPSVQDLSGYILPDSDCYTDIQTVFVRFPEYKYLLEDGKYRALEYVDGAWRFIENGGADGGERLHYTPIWIEDGEYVLSYTVTDVWTPAGMITAVYNVKVVIDGSMYDDWYKN